LGIAKKMPLEIALAILLFIILLASVLLVPFWHSFPILVISANSVFLQEYPVKAYSNEDSCILLHYHIPENILTDSIDARVFSQGTALFFERFRAESKDFTKTICFGPNSLPIGMNKIEILSMGNSLFFHLENTGIEKPLKEETLIGGIEVSKNRVKFNVENFNTDFYTPIELHVNGKLDHDVYPSQENQGFEEKINTVAGTNKVEIKFGGKTIATQFEQQPAPSLPFPLGIALLVFGLFAFSFFLFPKNTLVEKIGLGIGISFTIIITLVFALNYLGLLSLESVAIAFAGIALLAAFLCRKNFSFSKEKISWEKINSLGPVFWVAIALFFVVPVFFHLFSFTDITYWNKFYERQSELIIGSNSIPVLDELSYFGRSYSFAPGYFLLEAGISFITSLHGTELFAIMLVLANVFLFFALAFLGRAIGLDWKRTALFAMFAAMSGFLLSAMSYSPRHALAFAFFILALALLIKQSKPAITALLLAAMAFIQAPLLLFFPLFYLIIAKKISLKRMLASVVLGAAIFLLFMAPNLLLYGLPFEANAEEWGYLIDYNIYYWFTDIVALLVFFVLFSAVDLVKGKAGRDFYSKKLLAGVVLGTIIQLAIVFRWNLLTTTNLALLIAFIFPAKQLENSAVERVMAILALMAFGFLLFGVSYLNVHEIVTTPISFAGTYTGTGARILSDPMFGHDLTSVANRAVLADLRVEYANQEKLEDAYTFLEKKDYGIIKKYGITYTVSQVDYIHRQAIGSQKKYGIIEFDLFDKIFSNGFIFVHRVPTGFYETN